MTVPPLRLLHLEDDPQDAELIREILRRDGLAFEYARVTTEAEFTAALESGRHDVILADHAVPGFGGLAALDIVKARRLEIPFIFVTGTLGEEAAIETLKRGADDYVLKGRPDRLPVTIRRAIKDARERTRLRVAEDKLRASEARLAEAEHLARLGAWEWDVRADRMTLSDELYRLLDVDPRTFTPTPRAVQCCVLHEDREGLRQALERLARDLRPCERTVRVLWRDGGLRVLHVHARAEKTAGRGLRLVGTAQDVTERDAEREALRQSEERFRSLVETTHDWIWTMDTERRLIYTNPTVEHLLGHTPAELVGQNIFFLMHEEDRRMVERQMPKIMAAREGWSGWTLRLRHKDGTYRHMESSAVPLFDARGRLRGYQGIDRDVTERHRLQHQLQHALKMEAVGQLAGGLAHDFNNALMVVLGYAEMWLSETGNARRREELTDVKNAAERAARLTRQLLAFSRRQVLTLEVLDLNELLTGMTRTLKHLVGGGITLSTRLAPAPGKIKGDAAQIEQAVLNLVGNARDAMGGAGQLTLETAAVTLDADHVCDFDAVLSPGPHVRLSVQDTGTGLTAEVRHHLFEPFFTTKERHKAVGLGLSTVYGIVKQMGGHVCAQGEPGHGALFRAYFPVVPDDAVARAKPPDTPAAGGTETVLVVDDEMMVRGLLVHTLRRAGYTVLEAPQAPEALTLAHNHRGKPLDLLLTDVVMPGMNGLELAEELTKTHPGTRVIYMSGYTDHAVLNRHLLAPHTAFLQKPFTLQTLLRNVRQALDAPAGASQQN